MKLRKLIDNAYDTQLKKLDINDGEEQILRGILRLTSYIVEETVEINRELNHMYKPFKKREQVDYDKLYEEIADVFIYAAGLASLVATGEEMEQIIKAKLEKNKIREDHIK
jgi:NTP pyrophosphatase (non-canonical NTP hydrolase)